MAVYQYMIAVCYVGCVSFKELVLPVEPCSLD